MLIKGICKKCMMSWNEDDDFWANNILACPIVDNGCIRVGGQAPENCPYLLEHLVLTQEDGVE